MNLNDKYLQKLSHFCLEMSKNRVSPACSFREICGINRVYGKAS